MPRKFSFQEPESSRGVTGRADPAQAEEVFASLLFAPARSHASAPAAAAAGATRPAPARPRTPGTHKITRALAQSHLAPVPAAAPGRAPARSPQLQSAPVYRPQGATPPQPTGHEQALKSSFFSSAGGGGGFAKATGSQSARLREAEGADQFGQHPPALVRTLCVHGCPCCVVGSWVCKRTDSTAAEFACCDQPLSKGSGVVSPVAALAGARWPGRL